MQRQVGGHIEAVGFVVVHRSKILFAVLHPNVTRGAGAVAAACVFQVKAEMQRDVQQRFGFPVLAVRQFARLELNRFIVVDESDLRHIHIVPRSLVKNRKHIVIAIGLLIVLAVLGEIMRRQIPPRIELPFDTQSTVLAAEFMKEPHEVNAVFGGEHRYARDIQKQQYIDFVFIPYYVALFVILGFTLRSYADLPAPRVLAWTTIGLAVAAGALDIAENLSILSVASNPNAFSSNVRWFSIPKWLSVFVVMLLQSAVLFFWPGLKLAWRLAAVVIGFLFLFAGASGLLFTALVSVKDIEFSARWMGYALTGLLLFLIAILVRDRRRA